MAMRRKLPLTTFITVLLLALHCLLKIRDKTSVREEMFCERSALIISKTPEREIGDMRLNSVRIDQLIPNKPLRKVTEIDCSAVIRGETEEIDKGLKWMNSHPKAEMEDPQLKELAKNCTALRLGGYVTEVTKEELEFPLAFSILLHREAAQAEKLLRVMYRPHNTYCIHVDKKAPSETFLAMQTVADCFPNVFLAQNREDVVYGSVLRLQAELNCMEESLARSPNWKYYMNYASTMFPLKTNLELVRILKVYNGSNDINGLNPITSRTDRSFKILKGGETVHLVKTTVKKSPPPLGITLTKGSVYATFTREFCEFMLTHPVAQELLAWSKDTWSPDEHFASTLHHVGRNRHLFSPKEVPGSYAGPLTGKKWFGTYATWGKPTDCSSNYSVHGVCIYGLASLHQMASKPHFSANKFLLGFQPLTLSCMEEWYMNKTFSASSLDLDFYRKQPFVNNNWM